jgi:hypothetical protein
MDRADMTAVSAPPAGAARPRARHYPLLGGLLVKDGLINQAQLDRVLALQQQMEPRPLLGQLLVDERLVTPHELSAALGKYHRVHLLGDVLVETQAITPAQLDAALAIQRRTNEPLGHVLIQHGFIGERQLKQALAIQLRLPFVDLDQQPLDPSLGPVISGRYARHHQALPIARDGDRIVLAMDDPTDVDVVEELRACTGRRIDVVVATSDALARAFSKVYGDGDEPVLRPSRTAADEPVAPERSPDTSPGVQAPEAVGRPSHATEPAQRPGGPPTRSGMALEAIRARMESIRQFARSWERGVEAVDALLREQGERRAEVERLAEELRQSRTLLTRATEELDAKTHALTRLEAAHAVLRNDHDALRRSLASLEARQEALLRDREWAMEQIGAVLRQLRSEA